MRTLAKENEARHLAREQREQALHLAPVLCDDPNCGEQMHYSRPSTMYMTKPPKQLVHCPKCGYEGYLTT